MKKRVAFIINPISGGINKDSFPALAEKYLDGNRFAYELFYTSSTDHNKELARQCVDERFDAIVAVGGDGTINNTARYLTGSGIAFGIVPQGSGNGLARHLGINSNIVDALAVINRFNVMDIDTGIANDTFFINVAGVGFDAYVSWLFATAPRRGFIQYAKIALGEFAQYKPRTYALIIDGEAMERKAFIICAANGSQYGNNVYIAPGAIVNDGLFEITIVKSFNLLQAAVLGFRMFNKTLHRSPLVEILSGKNIIIKRPVKEVINIDGEAVMAEPGVEISIKPASLKVIIP